MTSETNVSMNVAGIRLSAVAAGIRYTERLDLVVIEMEPGSTTAGVFTRNAFCAAPVGICREHLEYAAPRLFVINTGNANAGTGDAGRQAALRCCVAAANLCNTEPQQVLPFSTGVIGEPLPDDRIIAGLEPAINSLAVDQWQAAATGIMTTDTVPKLASRSLQLDGQTVTVTGIAKGSGMIKPNMATMLAFVFTDAAIAKDRLQQLLQGAVRESFNRITVDGDTSTNDCCMLVATGASGVDAESLEETDRKALQSSINEVCRELAMGLIRDAEGASKFITINVSGGASGEECLEVAYTVAESPLVKTACFASDPNWGRILAAVGRAKIDALDLHGVNILLGDLPIVTAGAVDADYTEARGQAQMDRQDIEINISLGRGQSSETVWTSDLSQDYVRINADYRT